MRSLRITQILGQGGLGYLGLVCLLTSISCAQTQQRTQTSGDVEMSWSEDMEATAAAVRGDARGAES